jgi:hypothetical protein
MRSVVFRERSSGKVDAKCALKGGEGKLKWKKVRRSGINHQITTRTTYLDEAITSGMIYLQQLTIIEILNKYDGVNISVIATCKFSERENTYECGKWENGTRWVWILSTIGKSGLVEVPTI